MLWAGAGRAAPWWAPHGHGDEQDIAVAVLAATLVGVIVWVAAKAKTGTKMRSVTRLLFVTTQVAALGWVSVSYIIAFYATVRLGQPFPVTDLSGQAVTVILGVNIAKVVENIFEHNSGGIFGTSDKPKGV